MKRLLLINSVCGIGSTGRICADIAREYEAEGYEVRIAYGRKGTVGEGAEKYAVRIGSDLDVRLHGLYTRITDKHGLGSVRATKKFLKWADEYDPDVLWLHNIHGYYINYELLFDWIKSRPQMEVKWTLHDCWAFTGHCSHFTYVKCDKWKTGCKNCPQKKEYPASACLDNSENNYLRKKQAFCGVNNLTLITPSHWLEGLVKQSFLKEYAVEVIYNTIDKTVFKPTPSDFRQKHGIRDDQVMILGVSSIWNVRKGFHDFLMLSKQLFEKNGDKYRVVLVGLTEEQQRTLPKDIIGLTKTDSKEELAEIYTAADIFVNTTYEDTFPTVNLEAEACETRIVTYDTGGCRETITREDSTVIPTSDMEKLYRVVTCIND